MCGCVKIVVVPLFTSVEVQTVADFAVIRISMDIDANLLERGINSLMTAEQIACAKSLWSDDSYSRNFGYDAGEIVISCVPVY